MTAKHACSWSSNIIDGMMCNSCEEFLYSRVDRYKYFQLFPNSLIRENESGIHGILFLSGHQDQENQSCVNFQNISIKVKFS